MPNDSKNTSVRGTATETTWEPLSTQRRYIGMEKQEPREPEIQPCAEQADCLSLIISGEEETIDEPTDFGVAFGGKHSAVKIWIFLFFTLLPGHRPLSFFLIRVTDNTVGQHGPSFHGLHYKQRHNTMLVAYCDAQSPPSGKQQCIKWSRRPPR